MYANKIFQRTRIAIGDDAVKKLNQSTVAVFGVGGVGGAVVEMLARAGVGNLILVDFDKFDETNLNRQILSSAEKTGMVKTQVASERIKSINPHINVTTHEIFFDETQWDLVFDRKVDFVVDAIDSVPSKCFLIKECIRRKIKIISSMGAGNKLDTTKVKVADISKTMACGLAKAVRLRLRKAGIHKGLPVIFSTETPSFDQELATNPDGGKMLVGSISYMPNLFGIHASSYVIKRLIEPLD